jgi:predicted membrane protein
MPSRDVAPRPTPAHLTPQLVFGALVIVLGVLFLLDELGILQADRYARYWPAGLIAVGLLKLWQSRDGFGGALAGLIFTSAGVWLLLEELAVVRISFFDLWPLLLVFFGVYLVWQGSHQRSGATLEEPLLHTGPESPQVEEPRPHRPREGSATFTTVAVLGAVSRGNNSKAFRKADLIAIMGGCEIDLRQASIDGEAVMDVFAMWGGIDLRVPEDWTVVSRVTPLLGGVEDRTRPPQGATTHRLVLRGFAIMGGIEVKN